MNDPVTKPAVRRVAFVRLKEGEWRQLLEHQSLTGQSIPKILKSAFFKNQKLKVLLPESERRELLLELKRIGNNVNQLARRVNTGLFSGWTAQFATVAFLLASLERQLGGAHGNR